MQLITRCNCCLRPKFHATDACKCGNNIAEFEEISPEIHVREVLMQYIDHPYVPIQVLDKAVREFKKMHLKKRPCPTYEEEWRPFPDDRFCSTYKISNWGRLYHHISSYFPEPSHNEYIEFVLWSSIEKKQYKFKAHVVVYRAFRGEIPKGYQVNHKDRDKYNNSLHNLECLSEAENRSHQHATER
jgi:HNH endonuclease